MKVVAYRGQHCEADTLTTALGSLSFSSLEVAKEYALNPNISSMQVKQPKLFKVELEITKPFISGVDPFLELSDIVRYCGKEEARRVAFKFSQYIESTDLWIDKYRDVHKSVEKALSCDPDIVNELYFLAFYFFDDHEEVLKLKNLGFDGAYYLGSGVGLNDLEYRIFDVTQATFLESTFFKY